MLPLRLLEVEVPALSTLAHVSELEVELPATSAHIPFEVEHALVQPGFVPCTSSQASSVSNFLPSRVLATARSFASASVSTEPGLAARPLEQAVGNYILPPGPCLQ